MAAGGASNNRSNLFMKLGIMQPYFFPYIGYFQLINAVDTFVLHDDVQWIKNGWINRNRILNNGQDKFITLPLKKDSSLLNINQRYLSSDIDEQKQKIIRFVGESYKKSPYYPKVFELFERCMNCSETNVSIFVAHAIKECCLYLGIDTPIVLSSDLEKNNSLKGQDRVMDICRVMGATDYINPIGGMTLYDAGAFSNNSITLKFLKTRNIIYPQSCENHVQFLSIIDVMMFNSPQQLSHLLSEFDLV
jgi:hypothetical protein